MIPIFIKFDIFMVPKVLITVLRVMTLFSSVGVRERFRNPPAAVCLVLKQ